MSAFQQYFAAKHWLLGVLMYRRWEFLVKVQKRVDFLKCYVDPHICFFSSMCLLKISRCSTETWLAGRSTDKMASSALTTHKTGTREFATREARFSWSTVFTSFLASSCCHRRFPLRCKSTHVSWSCKWANPSKLMLSRINQPTQACRLIHVSQPK